MIRHPAAWALALLVAASLFPLAEAQERPQPSTALASWIEADLRAGGFPGASVAVVRDYRIAWARGFGLSDKERGVAVTPGTLFQAASVSKALTAAAAMIAFDEHGLAVDGDVNGVLRSFPPHADVGPWVLPNRDYGAVPVTLRRLLSHTAGTSDFRYSGYRYGYYRTPPGPIDPIPILREELEGLPPANTPAITVVRQPGARWDYSPAGYTVVQAVLMAIYGQDFARVMRRLVLAPLGMDDSTFAQPLPADLIPRMAVPYLPDGRRLPDGPRVFDTAASGGLTTTAIDLARFVVALQKALRGEPQGRITPRIARAMMERQPGLIDPADCFPTADPGAKACRSSWGLGLDVNLDRYLEHRGDGEPTGGYFGHTGFNSGFLSLLMGSKAGGGGVVAMVNMAPEDMSGPAPQFRFLTDLGRRVADEEGWR
jgi:CubicO group peptidase (beta-lactamase class C family)